MIDNRTEKGKEEVSGQAPTIMSNAAANRSSEQYSKRSIEQKQDSTQVKAGIDWDSNNDISDGQEVMEKYLHYFYGRSMKLGRQSSEPPRPREKKKTFQRRNLQHNDWAKDESVGCVVPCLSADTVRQSETHAHWDVQRKAEGEYSKGFSNFTQLSEVKERPELYRVEHADKVLKERSSSVPALRRNPVVGENCDAEPQLTGRSQMFSLRAPMSPGYSEPPAGMSSRHLETGAQVTSSNVNHADKTQPHVRGRRPDHGETPTMTSILKNAVAKDVDRMRMYREAYDRPFVELCSAFQQIREAQVKDAHHIHSKVNPHSSHNVERVLRHPAPQDPAARGRPAAGLSSGAQSPGRALSETPGRAQFSGALSPGRSFGQNSLNIGDALKWVC